MSAPQKDESPGAAGHFENQSTNAAILPFAEFLSKQDKQFATVQARFALLGFVFQRVCRTDDGVNFVASKRGAERYFNLLGDAERFLVQIGGGNV